MLLASLFKINYNKSTNNYLSMLHVVSCHDIYGKSLSLIKGPGLFVFEYVIDKTIRKTLMT